MKKQTAIAQSIARKKERVSRINELASPTLNERYERQILEREIESDQKLLEVEREEIIRAYEHGCHDGINFDMNLNDPEEIRQYAEEDYSQTYQTDGK